MVVSIYICEIPKNVNKKDIESLFGDYEGYIETRLKPTGDSRKIAFVDFDEEAHAHFTIENLQGFKFSSDDKGLILKISDNSKNGKLQEGPNTMLGNKRERSHQGDRDNHKFNRENRDNRDSSRGDRSDRGEGRHRGGHHSGQGGYKRDDEKANTGPSVGTAASNNNILDVINLLAGMSGQQNNTTGISQPMNPPQNIPPNMPRGGNFSNNPYTMNEMPTHMPQVPQQIPQVPQQTPEGNMNIMDVFQNIQALQLLSSIANNNAPQLEAPRNNNNIQQPRTNNFSSSFFQYDESLKGLIDIKKNATNIVYVEGLPIDASEREVSHIFRPFPGFKSVRLITREKKGEKSVLCFADFGDVSQSTICINTLQGYRFDKNDLIGLHFSYGISKHKK
jgi:RNA recognition motif-containing protein